MAYMVHLYREEPRIRGLVPPKEVDAYTSEYKNESDVIARFIQETCHAVVEGEDIPDPVLWQSITAAFQQWKRNSDLVGRGNTEDLKKRMEAQFGRMPRGGWTSFRFGSA